MEVPSTQLHTNVHSTNTHTIQDKQYQLKIQTNHQAIIYSTQHKSLQSETSPESSYIGCISIRPRSKKPLNRIWHIPEEQPFAATVYGTFTSTCNLMVKWFNGYPQGFADLVINFKGSSHLNKDENPLGCVYIPCAKGVSEKFKRIGNRHNIRLICRTKHILRRSLLKNRLERDPQQMA
jgi:hypothetical protein